VARVECVDVRLNLLDLTSHPPAPVLRLDLFLFGEIDGEAGSGEFFPPRRGHWMDSKRHIDKRKAARARVRGNRAPLIRSGTSAA